MARTIQSLLDELCEAGESARIEAKRAEHGEPELLATISALSNEPGLDGGFILLGVAMKGTELGDYCVTGVANPEQLQSDIASKCRELFSVPVRPHIWTETIDGAVVLAVRIDEAPAQDKPVHLPKTGLPKGAFRRIGATNQRCTEEDVALFHQLRGGASFDSAVLQDTTLADVDPRAVVAYRRYRAEHQASDRELALKDGRLLQSIGATKTVNGATHLTRAGLLLFGSTEALRRVMPSARVDYIHVDGEEWVAREGETLGAMDLRDPLLLLVPTLVDHLRRDLPKLLSLPTTGARRREVSVVPSLAIREAVVNAVMHRNYRSAQPVQVIRFSNRLEIRNPGHSLVPPERLGEPGSLTRNECIAGVLHEIGMAETKGLGVQAMRVAMEAANLTLPVFESDRRRDAFSVTLFTHNMLSPADLHWLGQFRGYQLSDGDARALLTVRHRGYIDNAIYRSLNKVDSLAASYALRALRDAGLLEMHGQSTATVYLAGPAMTGYSRRPRAGRHSKVQSLKSTVDLTPEEAQLVRSLRRGSPVELLRYIVLKLCARRAHRPAELVVITQRSNVHISTQIAALVEAGHLSPIHPESRNHPNQAYVSQVDPALLVDPATVVVEPPRMHKELPLFPESDGEPDVRRQAKRPRRRVKR